MMNPTTEAILQNLAEKVKGELRLDYSGRGMFGETCPGIDTDDPDLLVEEAVAAGIRGAHRDRMGKGYIVYWPQIKTGNE